MLGIFFLEYLQLSHKGRKIHGPNLQDSVIWPLFSSVFSCFSHVQLFAIPWLVACQAPLSMGFSRQEYYSGLSCPPPGDLPNPGIKPASLMSLLLASRFFTTGATWEALNEDGRWCKKINIFGL